MTAGKISLWNYFWKCHQWLIRLTKTQLLEMFRSNRKRQKLVAFCNHGEEKSFDEAFSLNYVEFRDFFQVF